MMPATWHPACNYLQLLKAVPSSDAGRPVGGRSRSGLDTRYVQCASDGPGPSASDDALEDVPAR